jgi:hypothetical protein
MSESINFTLLLMEVGSPTERNYIATERELLATILAT